MAAELHPDLVPLSYSTPFMRGMKAIRRLAATQPNVSVVLVALREALSAWSECYRAAGPAICGWTHRHRK
jgi:DNA-binding NarL/FixJ family response regulator